jgi:hypothetical protein
MPQHISPQWETLSSYAAKSPHKQCHNTSLPNGGFSFEDVTTILLAWPVSWEDEVLSSFFRTTSSLVVVVLLVVPVLVMLLLSISVVKLKDASTELISLILFEIILLLTLSAFVSTTTYLKGFFLVDKALATVFIKWLSFGCMPVFF